MTLFLADIVCLRNENKCSCSTRSTNVSAVLPVLPQEAYITFITNTMLKLMILIGVSYSSDDD